MRTLVHVPVLLVLLGLLTAPVRGEAAATKPPAETVLTAGELRLVFQAAADGIRVAELTDTAKKQSLTTKQPLPLFAIALRNVESKQEVRLTADAGWGEVQVRPAGQGIELRWQKPGDQRLGNLSVTARAVADAGAHAIRWKLTVENPQAPWSIWRVVFPQVAVAELGPQAAVLTPKGAGVVERGVWQRPFHYTGTYPNGWTSMQFLATYDEAGKTGLYVASHDPFGSTKEIVCQSRVKERDLVLRFEHPVPDMGLPGNRFELSGEAVWQLLRGDWFDAAVVYRDWARKEAKWYPRMTADGRPDTPRWMRELPVWALSAGKPEDVVPKVKEFAKYLGVPTAVHWYQWHEIPFDNDYPHYFPTKPGFAEAVRGLQASGVFVMPYINGRLWDTRDKGAEDFEFTRRAKPAVTKNEKGEPYTETYGSKEKDGSPVRLGVMCPTTELWQKEVRQIVLRLMNECSVQGVYIDQIAAAAPTLCFDKSHGHPLGGGHWWTEGYWRLLEEIRREKPKEAMLTTECNAEPYLHLCDGYLTWHWQMDGQVPAFPVVYGGAIQMFGRAYRGGPTKDLALRMKAGQQLVFGEQIGWLGPEVVGERENAEFLRQVVRLRQQLARYFYAGEMARPPRLLGSDGKIPTVRGDWQWSGPTWVTTDAVLTGAWRLPGERRLVLMFVNVDVNPVKARLEYDLGPYGFSAKELRLTKLTPEGRGETSTTPPSLHREITFPARSAWAWEVTVPDSK